MKLNFVLEISTESNKHYAFPVQEHICNNLYHAFDKYHNPKKGYQVVCAQFTTSKRMAEIIARNLNECYQHNGTLMTSKDWR